MDLFYQAAEFANVAIHRFVPILDISYDFRLYSVCRRGLSSFWNATVLLVYRHREWDHT